MKKWEGPKAIARDVSMLLAFTILSGVVITALAENSKPDVLPMAISNFFAGVFSFCIAGCIAKDGRWKHLFKVAMWTWVVFFVNVLFDPAGMFQFWLQSILTLLLMVALGGGLSFLFVKPNPKLKKSLKDKEIVCEKSKLKQEEQAEAGCGKILKTDLVDEALPELHKAVALDNYDDVHQFINDGHNVREIDEQGRTPIFYLKAGGSRIALLLIVKGADVNARDKFNNTPLHLLTNLLLHKKYSNIISVADVLIHKGADINAINDDGITPLLYASEGTLLFSDDSFEEGNIENVRYLLEKGADPNVADKTFGYTPLHSAVRTNHVDMVKLLIKHGAEIDSKNERNFTPTDVAYEQGDTHKELLSLLKSQGGHVNQCLFIRKIKNDGE